MRTSNRGRPLASSREVLADAALELFLEQGYEATSVTEIARRAGVSRASFFNYFSSKPETLWFVLDQRIDAIERALENAGTSVAQALAAASDQARPDTLALAIVDARTMGLEQELERGRADRQLRLAGSVAARLQRDGVTDLEAEIAGAGYSAALFGAVWQWAARGAGRHSLDTAVEGATALASRVLGGTTP